MGVMRLFFTMGGSRIFFFSMALQNLPTKSELNIIETALRAPVADTEGGGSSR